MIAYICYVHPPTLVPLCGLAEKYGGVLIAWNIVLLQYMQGGGGREFLKLLDQFCILLWGTDT